MTRLDSAVTNVQEQVTAVAGDVGMVQAQLWYAERDHRRIYLGGDRLLQLFEL